MQLNWRQPSTYLFFPNKVSFSLADSLQVTMATRHKEQVDSYLLYHKEKMKVSRGPSSINCASPVPGVKTSTCARFKEKATSSPLHGKPKLLQTARMQLTAKTINLDRFLPEEILLRIFSYLDVVSLLHASQVNKRWYALANDNSLWKSIAQHYSKKEKPIATSTTEASFQTQWKNYCISRCADWRNRRAIRLETKSPVNLFTGLPRDTAKALKEIGIQYQLSLVDSNGKENCTSSSKLGFHRSSVAVIWHSLSFLRMSKVRHLRILSICPLFYNNNGKVVERSPYQRSLLWEADVRLSDWVKEEHLLAADEQIMIYKLPEDLMMATWKADGEIAFFAAGLHFDQLLLRCLLGTSTISYQPQPHKVLPDDIDSSYGLHDYQATIELRSFHKSLWSERFSGLHCKQNDLTLAAACFTLITHDSTAHRTPLEKKLCLPWRTELFSGTVEHAAWLDVTILDERGSVFFTASSPVSAQKPAVKDCDFEYSESQHVMIKYEGVKASVHMQIGKLDNNGKAYVRHLEVLIRLKAINDWFGTQYMA